MSEPSELGPRTSADAAERTLAARIAQDLQDEIMSRRWPVGQVLGSEGGLMERFGASRSVIRESLRILESRWLARPRPGRGGGVVVTAPDTAAISEVTRLFVDYRGFEPAHLFETWIALEAPLVEQLAETATEADIRDLRAALDEVNRRPFLEPAARTVHTEIGRMSGNPLAELLLRVFSGLLRAYGAGIDPDEQRRLYDMHLVFIAAIAAGDGAGGVTLLEQIFRAMEHKDMTRDDGSYPRSAGA